MSDPIYGIFSNGGLVKDLSYPHSDRDAALAAAQDLSAESPDEAISVRSSIETPQGAWLDDNVASFKNGRPDPWLWKVTFVGQLWDADYARLEKAGITYLTGGTTPLDDEPTPESAGGMRHRMAVEAASADEANRAAREALGDRTDLYEWTSKPADQKTLQARSEG